jgi:fructose-1,6-bisphosphatase/sedoheptulose 1,7-bisphosphatase-like protein
MQKMGITDIDRIYRTEALAPGRNIIFAAAGVTEGTLLQAVRFFRDGIRAYCLVMTTTPRQVRFIDTIHVEEKPDAVIRF